MAEVTDNNEIPPKVKDELQAFVIKQCLQLHAMEKLLGTEERGKEVADFMKIACGMFLKFNLPERELIVRFLQDTHQAVHASMVATKCIKPMEEFKEELDYLMKASATMAKMAYEKVYKEDKDAS